jgi:hypothetical protein
LHGSRAAKQCPNTNPISVHDSHNAPKPLIPLPYQLSIQALTESIPDQNAKAGKPIFIPLEFVMRITLPQIASFWDYQRMPLSQEGDHYIGNP